MVPLMKDIKTPNEIERFEEEMEIIKNFTVQREPFRCTNFETAYLE